MTRSSTKRVRLWLGVGALTAPVAVLVAAHPSQAALPGDCHYVGNGPGVECNYGPGLYALAIPAGVPVDVTVTGGSGGNSGNVLGGAGASVHTSYSGAGPLNISVGRKGGNAAGHTGGMGGAAPAAGLGAGANGGGSTGTGFGAGGGGAASYVNDGTPALQVVAGGGGGAGGNGAGAGAGLGGAGGAGTDQGSGTGGSGSNGTQGTGVNNTRGSGGLGGTPGALADSAPDAVENAVLANGAGGGGGGGATPGAFGTAGTGTNAGGGGGGAGASIGGGTYSPGNPNSDGHVTIRYNACINQAVVSVGNASVVEGNIGDTPVMNFPITVSHASACSGFNLQVVTEAGTATPGTDYDQLVPEPFAVNIDPGVTHIVVPVTVLGDAAVEPNETFRLRIVSATPTQVDTTDPINTAHIGDPVGTGTIIDDDDEIAECADNAPTPAGYNLIPGTNGPDKLIGTQGRDIIKGFGGDDEILGGQGDDILCGGDGYDEILGGPGDDRISGGEGNDLLIGGSGQDTIVGDGGVNEIHQ
jgi:hypothetical protein